MKSLIKEYEKESSQEFEITTKERALNIEDSLFVGAQACQGCHPQAFEIWSKSKHAHAYETLQKKNRETNLDCISCHVVGWDQKGGFASIKTSPHLANIQCENCHGPRKEHIINPSLKLGNISLEECKKCHNAVHSPTFNKKTFWAKIFHGKETG